MDDVDLIADGMTLALAIAPERAAREAPPPGGGQAWLEHGGLA